MLDYTAPMPWSNGHERLASKMTNTIGKVWSRQRVAKCDQGFTNNIFHHGYSLGKIFSVYWDNSDLFHLWWNNLNHANKLP